MIILLNWYKANLADLHLFANFEIMTSTSGIRFFFPSQTTLTNRGLLKSFIQKLVRKEGKKLSGLNYVFCSDKELLRINQDFLQHDYYTDIITFGYSGPDEPIQGEIYISVDRVRDNARQLGVSFKKELHRVIFHGVLHLCGYRDKSRKEQTIMRGKEEEYLQLYL
jgi:probable rRNA maturation factor